MEKNMQHEMGIGLVLDFADCNVLCHWMRGQRASSVM